MTDDEKKLYALMAAAQDQQAMAREILNRVSVEWVAISTVHKELSRIVEEIEPDVRETIRSEIRDSLRHVSPEVAQTVRDAAAPAQEALRSVIKQTEGAAADLASYARWTGMKGVFAMLAGLCIVLGTAWAMVWWQRSEVASLRRERDALESRIAQSKANLAELKEKGGNIVLITCGSDRRLCAKVAADQINTSGSAQAYSTSDDSKWVILSGY